MATVGEILGTMRAINTANGLNARGFMPKGQSISVHKALATLFEPFDEDGVSEMLSKKHFDNPDSEYFGMLPQAIKAMWKQKGDRSNALGKSVDSSITAFFWNLNDPNLSSEAMNQIMAMAMQPIETTRWREDWFNQYKGCMASFVEFVKILHGHDWEPLGVELPMYDPSSTILGRADCVIRQGNRLVIIDWKTDGSISTENRFNKMMGPMCGYDDTKLNKYTMQVYFYKYMMHKVYNIDMQVDTIIVNLRDFLPTGEAQSPIILKPIIPYSEAMMENVISYAMENI